MLYDLNDNSKNLCEKCWLIVSCVDYYADVSSVYTM